VPSGEPGTIAAAAAALRDGTTTSVRLTEAALARADRLAHLGTYLTRFDRYARHRAEVADCELRGGDDKGPLQGITIGVKDLLCMAEGPTTAQSLVLDPEWGAGRDAAVVSALKSAGAVITGKVALSEFAIGRPDATKPFPVTRNPWDLSTWPGGSSSGTAVGIAAGLFLGGIGTDTGGSIRIPAAFCGISGLKPTHGLVPTDGCVPLASTQDHVGPMARSAEDCRLILEVIADRDLLARARRRRLAAITDGPLPLGGLRVAVVRADHFGPGADPRAEECFAAMLEVIGELGAEQREIELPLYLETRVAGLAAIQAEGFAYHRNSLRSRWGDYFDTTREMLVTGALLSAADYVQAQRIRRAARHAIAGVFEGVDIVVTPTLTVGAPRYGPGSKIDVRALLDNIHTGYWNATGCPALAIPMGFTAAGLPLSLQIVGSAFEDHLVTDVGQAVQRVTDWHLRTPPLRAGSAAEPTAASRAPDAAADDVATVRALLTVAGVPASTDELATCARAYPTLRAMIDSLYDGPPIQASW
jgi:aspartyl-tRNA(Asn)/glutamyl-tRNA(Gln) amidotransferase subunit A